MSNIKDTRVKSAWTPLSNEPAKLKMFDERRQLVNKWFDKWTDSQRKLVLDDILKNCKQKQMIFVKDIVDKKAPILHIDFTRQLPRVISLYIFSYLDPRSLCRSARVCFHWKYITELDLLWMPKCIKLGWVLPFSPSPFESGAWKRFYIEQVDQMKSFQLSSVDLEKLNLENDQNTPRCKSRTPRPMSACGRKPIHPPWKGSDSTPKDIWRYNYLDNDREVDKVNTLRKKGICGTESSELLKKVITKVNTGRMSSAEKRPSSPLVRSKSIPSLIETRERPTWAKSTVVISNNTTEQLNNSQVVSIPSAHPVKAKEVKDTTFNLAKTNDNGLMNKPWVLPNDEQSDSDN